MSSTEQADRDVPEKYDWRNYETPTKTTAKFLEDLVGSEESPKSQGSKRSSQSSTGSFVFLDPQTEQAPQTVTPLPLHPPTSHPADNPSAQYTPPASEKPEHSSKSHKSQESFASSVPRRLSDEFKHSHHRSSPLGHEHGTTTTDGTSPTDSHPARHHHTHTHTHNSHSRGHSRSRSSSESLSSLLLVTTERLSRETARANEAERKSSEIMSLFKHTFEAKTKLERDLIRVQQELEMYKVQLDAAQKEIYRAQDVVDRVERERVAALADAARARDKIHKLNETRAIELAMEEGRRFGFEEGLRQGRHVQPRRASHDDEEKHKRNSNGSASSDGSRSRRRASSRPPPASQPVEHPPPRPPVTQPLPVPTRTAPATVAAAAPPPPPPPPVHRHGTPPDVGNFQKLLPRPTITTPMPVQVPSTQPQPPPPMPPHQVPTTAHADLSAHSAAHSELKTSNNNVDRNGPIHPIPVWNHSPSVMHERITLPPDNFIPTMDANSVIALPPPHELSRPVPPDAPPLKKNDRDHPPQRPRSQSRGRERRRSLRLVDHDVDEFSGKGKNRYSQSQAPYHGPPPRDDASSFDYSAFSGPTTTKVTQKYATMPSRAPSGRSGGVLSPGSTHLSHLDLLSPPRDDSTMRVARHELESRYENPVYRNPSAIVTNPSPPQRIAQEWRNANREFITPPSTTIDPPPMRPPSSASQSIPRSPSRRPREIVMPAPLAEVYLNTTRTPRADRPFSDRLTSPDPNIIMLSHTPPDIEVVTPSTHASSRISVGTAVDPVLLSPASAHRPIPLPDHGGPEKINITPHDSDRASSNEYSGRSRPLSPGPIPGMADLNYKAYPPGFAPSLPKDHEAIAGSDFKYPSSPLMR